MRVAILLLGLGVGLFPSVAMASIETMGFERAENRNCSAPHTSTALWRMADGEIRLAGAGTQRFEFYGNGVDLTRDVHISGITGASARAIRGVGGAVNGARGCGIIGSLVIEITMPDVASANAGTLAIGGDRLAIKAVPLTLRSVVWNSANTARASSGASSSTTANLPVGSPPPSSRSGQPPCQLPDCDPTRPTNGVAAPRGASGGPVSPTKTLADCLAALGGSGTISGSGSTLTIQLPRQANAKDLASCGGMPMPIDIVLSSAGTNASMNDLETSVSTRPMPTLAVMGPGMPATFSCIGGTTNSPGASAPTCRLISGVGPAVTYSGQAMQSVTGSQQQTLQFTLAGTSQRLTVILQSTP